MCTAGACALQVQSHAGGAVKLLIPFLDMFNHRADCKHYLTGRTDGKLRVVAGEAVEAGQQVYGMHTAACVHRVHIAHSHRMYAPRCTACAMRTTCAPHAHRMRTAHALQVHIVYGTEETSNAELLCHYGFIDRGAAAADRRLVASQPEATAALSATSAQDDEAQLAPSSGPSSLPEQQQLAIRFRLALKRARDALARGAKT